MPIKDLVFDLPEVYQPIYGHADLDVCVSRSCEDRLEKILEVYNALESFLGRSLKVLDLGCAQGFFSLNLAQKGASVLGIDYLDKNIAVCTELASQNPELKVQFKVGRVEEVIAELRDNEFDLVLGLSVFHHIIHEKGIEQVQALLNELATKSGALILELALQEEPLYWGLSQPRDPCILLQKIPFVHMLAQCPTHLSGIARPLYFASSHYWVLDDKAGLFCEWSTAPYDSTINLHKDSRRYFWGNKYFVKQYFLDDVERGEFNLHEFEKEIIFIKNAPQEFRCATCLTYGKNQKEAWVVLSKLPGVLLLNLLKNKTKINHRKIIVDLLNQLVVLESANQFHADIRTWNILVNGDDEIFLIDYGAISSHKEDAVWPKNIYFAFLIFICELVHANIIYPVRRASFSPGSLPLEYQDWCRNLWEYPIEEWSFKLMRSLLSDCDTSSKIDQAKISKGLAEEWMKIVESGLTSQIEWLQNEWAASRQQADILKSNISQAKQEETRLNGLIETRNAELKIIQEAFLDQKAQIEWLQNEWAASRQQADILKSNISQAKQEETRLNGLIETRNAELKIIQEAFLDQKAQIEWLQNEWAASRQQADILKSNISQAKQEETRLNGLIETRNAEIEDYITRIKSLELHLIDSSARNDELNRLINECKSELEQVHHANHAHWLEVQNLRTQLDEIVTESQSQRNLVHERQKEISLILNSVSWRITHPLRVINKLIGLPRIFTKSILVSFIGWILNNQLLKTLFIKLFNSKFLKYSKLKNYIREFAIKHGVNIYPGLVLTQPNESLGEYSTMSQWDSEKRALFFLNQNEIKIYMELKKQLQSHQTVRDKL